MAGTSPFTLQSPSYHSSSYLPKLEANFMRDFSCCGFTLPSLHDLLQHYEEAHAQRSPQPPTPRPAQVTQAPMSENRATIPGGMSQPPQQNQQPTITSGPPQAISSPQPGGNPLLPNQLPQQPQPRVQTPSAFTASQNTDLPDLDNMDDIEMDDPLSDTTFQQQSQPQSLMQARFQENGGSRVTPLNLGMLQGQQRFRSSAPGTPVSPGRQLHNNPTVSSVNTPTLMPLPLQQQNSQFRSTPDSSAPGTPAELEDSLVGGFNEISMQPNAMPGGQQQFPAYGGGSDMLDLCIDEPAKRLFRAGGGFNKSQQSAQFRLGASHYGPNSDLAQHIREQQKLAGVPDTSVCMRPDDEPKPFRCPVIGCEKAYKNQNGLKYHKSVSSRSPIISSRPSSYTTSLAKICLLFSMAIIVSNCTTTPMVLSL